MCQEVGQRGATGRERDGEGVRRCPLVKRENQWKTGTEPGAITKPPGAHRPPRRSRKGQCSSLQGSILPREERGKRSMDIPVEEPVDPTPRRSSRRTALTEINDVTNGAQTPKSTSPDEQIILQRGPRRKPLTWSPYEYNRSKILGPPRDKTPEKTVSPKPDINLKLRRRLILTPEKNEQVYSGEAIVKRLRSFTKAREQCFGRN